MTSEEKLERVRGVLARHKAKLMSLPGVTGTGIGASDEGHGYVIVVYLAGPASRAPGPTEIEGVTVKYTVTGAIRPQNPITEPNN